MKNIKKVLSIYFANIYIARTFSLILRTDLNYANSFQNVVVVEEDVDLLIILCKVKQNKNNLFLYKQNKGESEVKYFNIDSIKHKLLKDFVGFIHAFSGCDTTFAFFKQGKITMLKILSYNNEIRNEISIFNSDNTTKSAFVKPGEKLITVLYGGKLNKDKPLRGSDTFKITKNKFFFYYIFH